MAQAQTDKVASWKLPLAKLLAEVDERHLYKVELWNADVSKQQSQVQFVSEMPPVLQHCPYFSARLKCQNRWRNTNVVFNGSRKPDLTHRFNTSAADYINHCKIKPFTR